MPKPATGKLNLPWENVKRETYIYLYMTSYHIIFLKKARTNESKVHKNIFQSGELSEICFYELSTR